MVVRARFKDGVAVPEQNVVVPDGTMVGIVFPDDLAIVQDSEVPPELREEFQFWEDASASAWEKFLEWEKVPTP